MSDEVTERSAVVLCGNLLRDLCVTLPVSLAGTILLACVVAFVFSHADDICRLAQQDTTEETREP